VNPESGFDAQAYWETRLRSRPDLRGTGHRAFSVAYNEGMYEVATDRLRDALGKAGISLAGKRVLDVGAGLGYFVERYVEWGAAQVTGVDITQASVETLRRRFPALTFFQADISSAELTLSGDYDLVFAISVLYHIVEEQRFERALAHLCSRVRPGGHLVLVDAFHKPLFPTAPHTRLRALEAYVNVLDRFAFRVVALEPMYFLMGRTFVPVVGPRLLSWPPVLRRLLQLERSLGRRLRSNLNGLKILIALRPAPA